VARETLEQLRARVPQCHINGVRNIWIVKPSGKSRGRGIKCFNNVRGSQPYVPLRVRAMRRSQGTLRPRRCP